MPTKREEWIKGKKKNFENPLQDVLKGVLLPLLDEKKKLETDLKFNWQSIMPAEINKNSAVKKLQFSKGKSSKPAALHLQVEPHAVMEISYQQETIIEKTNLFFGFKAVDKIVISKK